MHTVQENQGSASWLVQHPLSAKDEAAMVALRAMVESNKGRLQGVAARVPFDAIMERVSAPMGVVYEADCIRGVAGWWCRPDGARPGQAVMHLHGGWFNWGSAQASRNLAGHIAVTAGVAAFVPEYRLAPEHPFPAAAEDVRTCYLGLLERGFTKIAVTGDSAGGNLALGLLVHAATSNEAASGALVGGVVLSPVTNLALSGGSWSTRSVADPYFTRLQAEDLVRAYLDGHRADDAEASPLYADLTGLAPLRVHVGNDEVLLDDSIRLAERAAAAGVDVRLDVWHGMVHGYLGGLGRLAASTETLQLIGDFLLDRFANAEGNPKRAFSPGQRECEQGRLRS